MIVTPSIHFSLLIGSGALENSWFPVYRALKIFSGFDVSNPEVANLMMARYVLEPRYHNDYLAYCRPEFRNKRESILASSQENLKKFKAILSEELEKSRVAKEINVRLEQFQSIKSLINFHHSMIITTNWSVAEQGILGVKTFFPLHGRSENPESLYLPNETSVDRILTRDQCVEMGALRFEAIECMVKSHTIVFWGLGINALDIELTAVLSEMFAEKRRLDLEYKILIFDKKPKLVAEKISIFGANRRWIQLFEVGKD